MTEHQTTTPNDTSTETEAGAIEIFEKNPRLLIGLGAAAIVVMTLLAYAQVWRAGYIWDDDYYVTNNPLLRSWSGLQRIWFDVLPSPSTYPLPQYYPMTHTSFWIEYRLWGLDPTGYHVTNVVLHALNALLIWFILRKLDVPGAWLAAAIFAVHPVHVESVAWIAERKNVLSLFFFLGALYVYLRYAGIIPAPEKPSEIFALPNERERVWALALALFFFALASKTVTASLPAVALLIIWWKRGRISLKDDVVPLLPLFALGLGAAMLTSYMELHRVGARGPDWDHSPTLLGELAARILIAGKASWFYVYKLVVPYPLKFNYPRWNVDVTSPVQWLYPIGWLLVLGALVATVKRIGRAPLTAVLFYLGTLLPAMGFFNVLPMRYAFVADHFVYLPSIGLIALAAGGIAWLCMRYLPREISASGAPAAGAAAVLLVFMLLAFLQTRIYANERTLWEDTLNKTNQQSWFAGNNYANLLLDAGRVEEAEKWLKKVLAQKPDNWEAMYSMGLIAERRGDIAAARDWYARSLSHRADYVLPIFRLAVIAQNEGRLDEAEEGFRRIMALNPHDRLAPLSLGMLLADQDKHEEALDMFQRASDIDPEWASPFIQSGNVLLKMGRPEEAITRWAEASRLEPDNPIVSLNVGALFASSGLLPEAEVMFERALSLDPGLVEAHRQLGIVFAKMNRPTEARQHLEEAVRLDPQSERAIASLAAFTEGRILPATTRSSTAPVAAPATMPSR